MKPKLGDLVEIVDVGENSAHYEDRATYIGKKGILRGIASPVGSARRDWYTAAIDLGNGTRIWSCEIKLRLKIKKGDKLREVIEQIIKEVNNDG